MGNKFLRLLAVTLSLAVAISAGVGGAGFLVGWRDPGLFCNALFIAGGLLAVLGIFSVMGGYTARGSFGIQYAASAGHATTAERTQQWVKDLTQSYQAYLYLLLTGGFLVGISLLVGSLR